MPLDPNLKEVCQNNDVNLPNRIRTEGMWNDRWAAAFEGMKFNYQSFWDISEMEWTIIATESRAEVLIAVARLKEIMGKSYCELDVK